MLDLPDAGFAPVKFDYFVNLCGNEETTWCGRMWFEPNMNVAIFDASDLGQVR